MELKFREVDVEEYSIELEKGIKVKPFYAIAEMQSIISDMKSKDTELERHFSKVVLTGINNTNIDFTGVDDMTVYDVCASLGLIETFDLYLDMYHKLDDMVRADESIYKLISVLVDKFESKLDGFDITKIQEGFNGLKEVVKS